MRWCTKRTTSLLKATRRDQGNLISPSQSMSKYYKQSRSSKCPWFQLDLVLWEPKTWDLGGGLLFLDKCNIKTINEVTRRNMKRSSWDSQTSGRQISNIKSKDWRHLDSCPLGPWSEFSGQLVVSHPRSLFSISLRTWKMMWCFFLGGLWAYFEDAELSRVLWGTCQTSTGNQCISTNAICPSITWLKPCAWTSVDQNVIQCSYICAFSQWSVRACVATINLEYCWSHSHVTRKISKS